MGKKKKNNENKSNYVQYFFKDNSPKKLSKGAKKFLIILFIILLLILGFLLYEILFNKMVILKSYKYEEYDPNFNYEVDDTGSTSGWSSITTEKLETYREIKSNINKEKESNSNKEEEKTEPPEITKIKLSVEGASITVKAAYTDKDSPKESLKVAYSINSGKTWQEKNVFKNLKLNTKYTVTVRVTDDKGNVTTKSESISTPSLAKANVSGVYKSGNSIIYIYQVNSSTIIYSVGKPTMSSTHRATLTSNKNGIKLFSAAKMQFDSANLIYNGKQYGYSSKVDTDELFKSYYGGYLDSTSSYNGHYQNIDKKGYTMDIVPIRVGATRKLYIYFSGGGKSKMIVTESKGSKFSYSANGETLDAQFYLGNVKITATSSNTSSILASVDGNYARYKSYTMESAVIDKLGS